MKTEQAKKQNNYLLQQRYDYADTNLTENGKRSALLTRSSVRLYSSVSRAYACIQRNSMSCPYCYAVMKSPLTEEKGIKISRSLFFDEIDMSGHFLISQFSEYK